MSQNDKLKRSLRALGIAFQSLGDLLQEHADLLNSEPLTEEKPKKAAKKKAAKKPAPLKAVEETPAEAGTETKEVDPNATVKDHDDWAELRGLFKNFLRQFSAAEAKANLKESFNVSRLGDIKLGHFDDAMVCFGKDKE